MKTVFQVRRGLNTYKSGSISILCGSEFMEPKKTEDRDLDSERAPYLGLGNAAHDFVYKGTHQIKNVGVTAYRV